MEMDQRKTVEPIQVQLSRLEWMTVLENLRLLAELARKGGSHDAVLGIIEIEKVCSTIERALR